MNIIDFIGKYKNHPILFIGTGMSLRYLKNSYTWDNLLKKIAYDFSESEEYYLDIKSKCYSNDNKCNYLKVAEILENDFNSKLENDRNGKFKKINDIFYEKMKENIKLSRFKIYLCELLSELEYREDTQTELKELKKIRKNIGSVITTNYDSLIEDLFEFNKLIGNKILLSNPYGSVYKIHGCVKEPEKIIIKESDYKNFDNKYELIRAQLLSLFIHNPIIFMGYSITDDNIKKILKTIFTYVEPNSKEAENIKNNFLLVEYEKDNQEVLIAEHDIVLEDPTTTIRINKVKTDNFTSIYNAISNLHLPISALDVRKVQTIVKEIYAGGEIKVSITEDVDSLKNSDKILAIGSSKTIQYHYQTEKELLANYFSIIEESNSQILSFIDKYQINQAQYFPIFGFSSINSNISCASRLKKQQKDNIKKCIKRIKENHKKTHSTVESILNDNDIPTSYKMNCIIWNTFKGNISLDEVESFLKTDHSNETAYRKLLTLYDLKKYGDVS